MADSKTAIKEKFARLKHLQGQHDQELHGNRGGETVTDDDLLDRVEAGFQDRARQISDARGAAQDALMNAVRQFHRTKQNEIDPDKANDGQFMTSDQGGYFVKNNGKVKELAKDGAFIGESSTAGKKFYTIGGEDFRTFVKARYAKMEVTEITKRYMDAYSEGMGYVDGIKAHDVDWGALDAEYGSRIGITGKEWRAQHKHLSGQHDQRLHGNRGLARSESTEIINQAADQIYDRAGQGVSPSLDKAQNLRKISIRLEKVITEAGETARMNKNYFPHNNLGDVDYTRKTIRQTQSVLRTNAQAIKTILKFRSWNDTKLQKMAKDIDDVRLEMNAMFDDSHRRPQGSKMEWE